MIVMLGGAISCWWLEPYKDTLVHKDYVRWRDEVQDAFIQAGHLTIRSDLMFKGRWVERAQKINDLAIKNSDAFVDMTPVGIPSEGSRREQVYAWGHSIPTYNAPPWDWYEIAHMLQPLEDPYACWESAATHPNAYRREL